MDNAPDLRISRMNRKTGDVNLRTRKIKLLPSLSLDASYASPGVSGRSLFTTAIISVTSSGPFPATGRGPGTTFSVSNMKLDDRPDPGIEPEHGRVPGRLRPGPAGDADGGPQPEEPGAAGRPGNPQRRPDPPDGFKQVQAYKVASDLAEKTLAAEEERFRGRSEHELPGPPIPARPDDRPGPELKAIIDYNIAQAGLDRSMGTLLETRNVRIADCSAAFEMRAVPDSPVWSRSTLFSRKRFCLASHP